MRSARRIMNGAAGATSGSRLRKPTTNVRVIDLVSRQDARHRLVLGLAAGAAVFFAVRGHLRPWSAAIAGWNAVAVVILALDWVTIWTKLQRKIRQLAQQQDLSRFLVFIFVVVTSSAALLAVGFLVSVKRSQSGGYVIVHLLLTLMTVVFSWMLVHTVYGLRYAHAFYCDSDESCMKRHAVGLIVLSTMP